MASDTIESQVRVSRLGCHLTIDGRRMVRSFAGRRWYWIDVETGVASTADELIYGLNRRPDQQVKFEEAS